MHSWKDLLLIQLDSKTFRGIASKIRADRYLLSHAGNVVPIVMFTAELAVLSEEGGQVKGEFDETDE